MNKLLGMVRTVIGYIVHILLLVRWPLTFSYSGKLLPKFESRRLKFGKPLVFVPILHLPWKGGAKLELVHLRFEVTDFILIVLSIWMVLAVFFTPTMHDDIVGMVASIEAIRNLAYLMVLVSLFDRDGGKIQTAVLVTLGLVYNWSLFQLDGALGTLPFAAGSIMILALQFLGLPAFRFWQSRWNIDRTIHPDPFDVIEEQS